MKNIKNIATSAIMAYLICSLLSWSFVTLDWTHTIKAFFVLLLVVTLAVLEVKEFE